MKSKQLLLSTALLFIVMHMALAQNTVGLLSYDMPQSYDGYNLMFPHNQPSVFLLDNCGEIVNEWTDEANFRPGNIAYLRKDGSIVKGKRDAVITDDAIWAGGGGETIEIRDWDNNLTYSKTINDSLERMHHDFALMKNGNILMIVWEYKSMEESIEAGRDTTLLSQQELWPDKVVELNPNTDEIVWEWHVWDHLIQDFDSTKANYGVVSEHMELVDLNWDTNSGKADWMHSNAIDYNEELDQIILSVPTFHEFWIIDHTTTTAEAKGHTGGLSGKGGDLMYRWGNPATYRAGTEADQKLFYPHDVHWIDDHLDFTNPEFGKIGVFNNRVGEDFSTANIIEPIWDMYEWGYFTDQGTYLPTDYDRTFLHPDTTALHSTGLSSFQILPNGNSLICSGRHGYTFEMTPSNEIVWEYKTPIRMGQRASQGDTLTINNNLTFRMKRYPVSYEAFIDKDLSSKGWIEMNPNMGYCAQLTPTEEILDQEAFKIYPNPAQDYVTIEWDGMMYANIEILDVTGRTVHASMSNGGRIYVNTSNWTEGVYFVSIDSKYSRKLIINK